MEFSENEALALTWLEQAKVRLERAADLGSEAAKNALKALDAPAKTIALSDDSDKTPTVKPSKK